MHTRRILCRVSGPVSFLQDCAEEKSLFERLLEVDPDKCCDLGPVPYDACAAERFFDKGEREREREREGRLWEWGKGKNRHRQASTYT